MDEPLLEVGQQSISIPLLLDTREALKEVLDSLREGIKKQDLKLALALILNRDLQQGFSPDELREVGVKDVPKCVAEPIRHILLLQSIGVSLVCKRQRLCDGRIESRYHFVISDVANSNQMNLHF